MRFAYKVCDESGEVVFESDQGWELLLRETSTRQQLRALFFEDSREIPYLAFQRFHADGRARAGERFVLSGREIANFAAFLALVSSTVDFVESDAGVRLDLQAVRELLKEDSVLATVYSEYGEAIRELVAADVGSPEVTALARRRNQVDKFERMLDDPDFFDQCRTTEGSADASDEAVWQRYFEANRWIFGTGLAPQFLHSWSEEKLEQVVVGASAFGPGKRADGLMRTVGVLSALVFVEIETHVTPLLHSTRYRSGVWRVGEHVSGGVAQCQMQVDTTVRALDSEVERKTSDGWSTDEWTVVCRPRSVFVVGSLEQFVDGDQGRNLPMFESFERFRRSITDPEIVTFDELYARARMAVSLSGNPA